MANAAMAMMTSTPMASPPKRNPTNTVAASRLRRRLGAESGEDAGSADDRDDRPDQDGGADRNPAVARPRVVPGDDHHGDHNDRKQHSGRQRSRPSARHAAARCPVPAVPFTRARGPGQELQLDQRRGHRVAPPLALLDGLAQVGVGTGAVEGLGDHGGPDAIGRELESPSIAARLGRVFLPARVRHPGRLPHQPTSGLVFDHLTAHLVVAEPVVVHVHHERVADARHRDSRSRLAHHPGTVEQRMVRGVGDQREQLLGRHLDMP